MQAQQAEIEALKTQSPTTINRSRRSNRQRPKSADAGCSGFTTGRRRPIPRRRSRPARPRRYRSTVSDLKNVNASLTDTVITTQKQMKEATESPTAIHYKGITITPVAFFAFEGVYRQHSVNSDINTPFNSIPFPSANEGHVSELNFSGRQSRLGGLFEGNAGSYKLTGYFETDFLGTGTSSNNNQSNSYVLRQRQIWGKAEKRRLRRNRRSDVVAGHGRRARARMPARRSSPTRSTPQYMVGFSWTRQPAIRLQQRFRRLKTGQFTLAVPRNRRRSPASRRTDQPG